MGAAERLQQRLQHLTDAFPDEGILAAICSVLAAHREWVDAVATDSDTHVAWGAALDPEAAPAEWLPWLAQFARVDLPPGAGETEQRARILESGWLFRGTTAAEVAEIQRRLTGAKTVRVLERVGGDDWAQTIVTRTAETPDPDAVMAAWLQQKPAGIVPTHVVSDAPIWAEGTLTWADVTATWASATLADVT